MSETKPILEFQEVSLGARPPNDVGLEAVSFTLAPGEIILLEMERGHGRFPLADAAEGLVEPERGAVLFTGEDWRAMSPDASSANRGRIGRVFESAGWVSNLNIDENVTLSQRHHTQRPLEEIAEEAERLARSFGLTELPKVRPAVLKRSERKISEWVRAFLGKPALIIMEEPTADAYNDALPLLINGVDSALARGAGVLWIASELRVFQEPRLTMARRGTLRGPQLTITNHQDTITKK